MSTTFSSNKEGSTDSTIISSTNEEVVAGEERRKKTVKKKPASLVAAETTSNDNSSSSTSTTSTFAGNNDQEEEGEGEGEGEETTKKKKKKKKKKKNKSTSSFEAEPTTTTTFVPVPPAGSHCGLCGKTGKMRVTKCCKNIICDDYDKYQLMSFARNSCSRNHDRYTVCNTHFELKHRGAWQKCLECQRMMGVPSFADQGTNEYNFVKLANPPKYTITCSYCPYSSGSLKDFPSISYKFGDTKKSYACITCYKTKRNIL
ncbi:hypothetical protein DFA_01646 [Cavenderia fasciculata]|uniref:Uncharacterized protein n=1 Tax=Cavenderia fasciculata TaxID=261658 RepID=F4PTZ2_CACFS|nr:uncharacterized protein DFA_01646 [Cavenderia fasciculata]EGG21760.1 hypothetical protein DFA_01646 [Cavenderia fasciculata]|eukprot:XP_004359610.1 hypothetical protein DFA_01646 [Cavenderia fasciculata]